MSGRWRSICLATVLASILVIAVSMPGSLIARLGTVVLVACSVIAGILCERERSASVAVAPDETSDVRRHLDALVESCIDLVADERGVAVSQGRINEMISAMLRPLGICSFEATGSRFDPKQHMAVDRVIVPAEQVGLVVQTERVGWRGPSGVVRPPEVVVGYGAFTDRSAVQR